MIKTEDPVLVVGAGIMGSGIAQIAAQAGHTVLLFDARPGAAAEARGKLTETFKALAAKGKISPTAAREASQRIEPIGELKAAANAGLVVEAIVEKLDAKRALFRELEGLLPPSAVLATNTSSISVTAIANGLDHPERVVGMHFFNPVPVMRLVEVVSGLQTDPAVAEAIFELSRAWRKVPVYARSTPGFIVNRIARPYYAEALALLQEQATDPANLDRCLAAAGFRMGPCELMDLIGHDTNLSVTQSVYEANFFDKRYVPSLIQRELVDGGLLGRKSGRGFFVYPRDAEADSASEAPSLASPPKFVTVHGMGADADRLFAATEPILVDSGAQLLREAWSDWTGLEVDGARLVQTDGRTAFDIARDAPTPDIAVFDRPFVWGSTSTRPALAYAPNEDANSDWKELATAWLVALGFAPVLVRDTPGLIVARTISMLVNEAADAVQQGVCDVDGANVAMKLGVNYPVGPFEWLDGWGTRQVVSVIRALDAVYRGERYRVSPWLRSSYATNSRRR